MYQIWDLYLIKLPCSWWSTSCIISRIIFKSLPTISFLREKHFSLIHPTNNPLQYHFYISPTRYLTFYIPVIYSERKSSPMYMIDGTIPQLNSITKKTVICFSIKLWCRRRGLLTLSLHRWNLDISFTIDNIQDEVCFRSEHASPNTWRHQGQLFPAIDRTDILSRAKSIRTHVPGRIVSVLKMDCIVSSFSIFTS